MGRRLAVRAALEHRHYLAVAYSQVSVDFSNFMSRTLCQSECSLKSAQSRTALLSSHTQKEELFLYIIGVCDANPSRFWGRSLLNYVGHLCVPNPYVALGAIHSKPTRLSSHSLPCHKGRQCYRTMRIGAVMSVQRKSLLDRWQNWVGQLPARFVSGVSCISELLA